MYLCYKLVNVIKVFTTSSSPDRAGNDLTNQYDAWLSNLGYKIEIISIHSNSNKYGWMLVIQYKKI